MKISFYLFGEKIYLVLAPCVYQLIKFSSNAEFFFYLIFFGGGMWRSLCFISCCYVMLLNAFRDIILIWAEDLSTKR